jgi:hypothetical protein
MHNHAVAKNTTILISYEVQRTFDADAEEVDGFAVDFVRLSAKLSEQR